MRTKSLMDQLIGSTRRTRVLCKQWRALLSAATRTIVTDCRLVFQCRRLRRTTSSELPIAVAVLCLVHRYDESAREKGPGLAYPSRWRLGVGGRLRLPYDPHRQ